MPLDEVAANDIVTKPWQWEPVGLANTGIPIRVVVLVALATLVHPLPSV